MDSSVSTENYQLELPYKPSSVSVYWKKITIPKGLPALLETFVRETIRDNPEDIYKYLSDLTESLLAKRGEEEKAESTSDTVEDGNVSAPKVKPVDEESPLLAAKVPSPSKLKLDPEAEKQDEPEEVVVIPSSSPSPRSPQQEDSPPTTLGDSESPNISDILPLEVAAVTKLQAGYRGYKTRKSLKEQRKQQGGDQAEESSRNENDEQESSLTTAQIDSSAAAEEENAAATKLQANFRGFQARKGLRQQLEQQQQEGNESEAKLSSTTDDENNVASEAKETTAAEQPTEEEVAAATKLQAGFRGFQTRKALKGETPDQPKSSSRPGSPAVSSQLETSHVETTEPRKSPTPTIPENEELVVATAAPSTDPVSDSPFPPSNNPDEANDEEIAAEIKTPLETIREESFDHSISSCNTVQPPPLAIVAGKVELETSPTPPETTVEETIEDILQVTSKNFKTPREEKIMNLHVVSTEEVTAALGGMLDDTEDEREESSSGSDPSLQEHAVTKETPNADVVDDGNNNDTDNKNDELKSSSADDHKDGNNLAPSQNDCDHQLEDGPGKSNSNEEVSPINDLVVDTPHPQDSDASSSVVNHNEGDRVEAVDDNMQNIPNDEGVESKEEEKSAEQPQEVINLSPSEDASDRMASDGKEQGESGGGGDDQDDKNKPSESPKPVDDDEGNANKDNVEIEEVNAEENTQNIINVGESPIPQEKLGQQAHEDDEVLDDDDGNQINHGGDLDAEEKSESIHLQNSNVSALTDSSVDREDTDIATPTDFSTHEEKESLNLEELKKFASNFDTEMEPASNTEEGAGSGTEVAAVPAELQSGEKQAPTEVSSSSPEDTSSSPAGELMQVEVKASESTVPEPAQPQLSDDSTKEEKLQEEAVEEKAQSTEAQNPEASEISPTEPANEITPNEPAIEEKANPDIAETASEAPQQSQESSEANPEQQAHEEKAESSQENAIEQSQASPVEAQAAPEPTPESTETNAIEQQPSEEVKAAADADFSQPIPDSTEEKPEEPTSAPEATTESKDPEPETSSVQPLPESTAETSNAPEQLVDDTPKAAAEEPTTAHTATQDTETAPIVSPNEDVTEPSSSGPTPQPDETAPKPESEPEPTKTEEIPQSQSETSPPATEEPRSLETPQEPTSIPSPEPLPTPTNEPEQNAAPVTSNETVESPPGGSDTQAIATPSDNLDEIAKPTPTQRESGSAPTTKPTVRPRLSTSKQSKSVAAEDSAVSAIVGEDPSASSVLRRPKSGSGRSRAATSKYRSGRVIDTHMSMEAMEKEIEDEMMNNAAVKIQAGFRGFKTRKTINSQYGVSKKGSKREEVKGESKSAEGACAAGAASSASCEPSASSIDIASAERLPLPGKASGEVGDRLGESIASRGAGATSKPPLSALRSHSFPGHHEPEEMSEGLGFDEVEEDQLLHPDPEIDLDLDPDYINKAAVRIQKSFRGYQVRKSLKRCPGKENSGSKGSSKSMKLARSEGEEKAATPRYESQEIIERLHEHNNNDDEEEPAQPEKAAAKIQASFRSYKERTKYQKKKKAAITLQANIRGFLTRKRLANLRRRSFQRRRSSGKAFQKEMEDIRKVNDAATKIQAVFRGYQVRSKILPRSSSMISEHEQMVDE